MSSLKLATAAVLLSTACGDDAPAARRDAGMTSDSAAPGGGGTGGIGEPVATTGGSGVVSLPDGSRPSPPGVDAGSRAPEDGGGLVRDADSASGDTGAPPNSRETGPNADATASSGCGTGPGLSQGEQRFMLDGRERRYVVHLPGGYDPDRPWPVVFALHGNGGSIDYWNGQSGDRNIRATMGGAAIVVIVEAIEGNWRDYDMSEATWPPRIEAELGYFDAVLEQLTDALCVDTDEIFAMGFSGGGSFSGVLACRRDYIRAIAVGGSVIYFDEADCGGAVAAWITVGTQELSAGREAFRDYFRVAAGCQSTSAATDPDPCVAYDGCAMSAPVHYCQHPGDHFWPAFGTEASWAFFQRFIE